MGDGSNRAVHAAAARPDLVDAVVCAGRQPGRPHGGRGHGRPGRLRVGAGGAAVDDGDRLPRRAAHDDRHREPGVRRGDVRDARQLDRASTARRRSRAARMRSWIEDDALEPARALGDRLWMLEHGGNPWFPIEVARRTRELLPEAHIHEVEDGAVSRPDITGSTSVRAPDRREGAGSAGTRKGRADPRPFVDASRAAQPQTGQWPAAAAGQQHRRAPVLLALGGRSGVALAADARPGPVRELVLAAVGAAAADRARVAVRLAGGDPLQGRPHAPASGRRAGRAGRHARCRMRLRSIRIARCSPRLDHCSLLGGSHPARRSPSVALRDQPVRAVPELQEPVHEPLVSDVGCLSLSSSIVTVPIGCRGSIPAGPAGAGSIACPSFGAIAEIATAGTAAAMPTLITAIRGAFNGPPHVVGQWSASLPRAAFASSHLLRGVPTHGASASVARPLPGPCGRVAPVDAAPEGVAASLACITVRSGRPLASVGAGRSVLGYRCFAYPAD